MWIHEFGLDLPVCWEKLQSEQNCDLSQGLFLYAGATPKGDKNCGCPKQSDCKSNFKPAHNGIIYEFRGAKKGSLIFQL